VNNQKQIKGMEGKACDRGHLKRDSMPKAELRIFYGLLNNVHEVKQAWLLPPLF
jgi:hypothetical protein